MLKRNTCIVCKKKASRLFFIPKDRILLWLKNVKQESLLEEHTVDYIRNNGRICDAHFEDKYFTSTIKDKLNKFAVPFDPLPTLSSCATSSSIANISMPFTSRNPIAFDASQDLSSFGDLTRLNLTSTPKANELTPKTQTIRKLRCDISRLKKKLTLKDEEIDALEFIRSDVGVLLVFISDWKVVFFRGVAERWRGVLVTDEIVAMK